MSQGQFYILQLTILIPDILRRDWLEITWAAEKTAGSKHKNWPQNSAFSLIFVPWICASTEVEQGAEP